jgi:7-dehydrocholesterol reductase
MYDFYRGCELHPRLFGCDVKQLTNCRIGLMMWQILILAFCIASYQKSGFNPGNLVTLALQTIYLTKFFHWETGYFNTLDITYDRAGYYLCWGCLVWVPSMYTLHSYSEVAFPSQLTNTTAFITFLSGVACVLLNYRVDYEKETFQAWFQLYLKDKNKVGKLHLWGKPVTFVETVYKTNQGVEKKSALLTSGFWGLARHDNYTFELLSTLCWCLPAAIGYGLFPMLYFFFLVFLLVHRIYRDEDKCSAKYGKYWDVYCKAVPYRMIPFVY